MDSESQRERVKEKERIGPFIDANTLTLNDFLFNTVYPHSMHLSTSLSIYYLS